MHPDICEDEVVAALSAYAFRTWVLLWTHLDDKGRGPDNAKLLKGKLYPLDDSMTVERVEKDLVELTAKGLLQRYEVDSKRYLTAKPHGWARYQKPQHPTPSKLPPPPDPSRSLMTTHEDDRNTHPGGELEKERSGAKGEGESEGEVAPAAPVDNPAPAARRARELADRAMNDSRRTA